MWTRLIGSRRPTGRDGVDEVSNEAHVMRQRCQLLVASLDLPDPFDIGVLVEQVAARRQRRIRLVPMMPGLRDHASGATIPCGDVDYIFAEAGLSNWYWDHVILHELGHMLWEHVGSVVDGLEPWLSQYGVKTSPGSTVSMRCWVDAQQEQEAELFAVLVEARITQRVARTPAATSTPGEVAEVLSRLADALGSTAAHQYG